MNIQGGQLTQTNGNPANPGTLVSGPLLAGNIQSSDGTTNLAGVGALNGGIANVGYVVMAQTDIVTQATNGSSAGVFTSTNIVIPAQSQILRISGMITTAWSGSSATFGLGDGTSATALTASGAASGATLGPVTFSPGTNAGRIATWDNVGANDIQLVATSTNTGNGVMTLTVEYLQAINQAS